MTARAFCIRLKRNTEPVAGWLPYRQIEIDASVIRIVLCDATPLSICVGARLTLETALASVEVMLQGIIDDQVLILHIIAWNEAAF